MRVRDVLRAWERILTGYRPFLSLEITRECPLHCPGCYAFDTQHLGGGVTLRDLTDHRGYALVRRVLELTDRLHPLHVSLVGGDPLVRCRELEEILPALAVRKVHTQVVTSAFRPIPPAWASLPHLQIAVSVDGLQPEHDVRRHPATYERILRNISGHKITIHWTMTAPVAARSDYIRQFLDFWNCRPEVERIWISLFSPQKGATREEIIPPDLRLCVVRELRLLRSVYTKLDLWEPILSEMLNPPLKPSDCVFAQLTYSLSADLQTRVHPCQLGGDPDCSQCGCLAALGLNALAHVRLLPGLTLKRILKLSSAAGRIVASRRNAGVMAYER